ncbi:MAG: Ig-specific serine endopeptidase MIP [Metamycoplasmataceae bacterium]
MMKNKKILFPLFLASVSLVPALSLKCGKNEVEKGKEKEQKDENNKNPNKPNNPQTPQNKNFSDLKDLTTEFQNIVNSVEFKKTFDFKLKAHHLADKEYSKLLPTQVKNNFDKGIDVIVKEHKNELDIEVLDVIVDYNTCNKTGQFKLSLKLIDKKTKQIYNKVVSLSGFATSPYGADENGKIPGSSADTLKPDSVQEYVNADQQKRYDLDNKKYLQALQAQQMNKPLDEVRTDLKSKYNQKGINNFNEKAKTLNQDSYESAARKGYTVPTYDSDGNFKGLAMASEETAKGPSWVDSLGGRNPFQINGLARTLPNKNYLRTARQTFGVTITNEENKAERKYRTTSGTMWVMDYEKRADGKYPTKWYFGTNLHVADALNDKTTVLSFLKLMNTAREKTTFRLTNLDDNFNTFSFIRKDQPEGYMKDNGVKTIYSARNFLSTKPSDYLNDEQKEKYKDTEEFLDFSIFEVDFEKMTLSSVTGNINGSVNSAQYKNMDPHELAKMMTNGYAEDANKGDRVKFKSTSYLKDYSKIDYPLTTPKDNPEWYKQKDELFAVGYPNSTGDYFLRQYIDEDQIKYRNQYNFSLWTNSDYRFYNQLTGNTWPESKTERGNYLSYALGYRSFTDKPGLADAFISAPHTGNSLYKSNDNKEYIAMGLEYAIRHYAPVGGASGSSVRTQNNELVGVYHVSNSSAHTGLAAAFRSEGYNYNGLYGQYNLPQYDLIYGGGQNQTTSYRQALLQAYGKDYKTGLFEDGVENIPEEYKFN